MVTFGTNCASPSCPYLRFLSVCPCASVVYVCFQVLVSTCSYSLSLLSLLLFLSDNSSAHRHDMKDHIPYLMNARPIIAAAPIIWTHCWWTTDVERPQFICRPYVQVDDIRLLVSQLVRQEQQVQTGGYHGVTSHSVWTQKDP